MTYTVLPNSGQSLGVTRVPINTNFSLIQSVFAQNHVGFNSGANSGKHKFVQMPAQASSPGTAAAETAIYSRTALLGVSNETNLYWQFPNTAATGPDVVMTRFITPVLALNGITFLPGGLILQWGTVALNANPTSTNVTFPVTFPNNVFNIIVSMSRDSSISTTGQQVYVVNAPVGPNIPPSTAGFVLQQSSSAANNLASWMAIGF